MSNTTLRTCVKCGNETDASITYSSRMLYGRVIYEKLSVSCACCGYAWSEPVKESSVCEELRDGMNDALLGKEPSGTGDLYRLGYEYGKKPELWESWLSR